MQNSWQLASWKFAAITWFDEQRRGRSLISSWIRTNLRLMPISSRARRWNISNQWQKFKVEIWRKFNFIWETLMHPFHAIQYFTLFSQWLILFIGKMKWFRTRRLMEARQQKLTIFIFGTYIQTFRNGNKIKSKDCSCLSCNSNYSNNSNDLESNKVDVGLIKSVPYGLWKILVHKSLQWFYLD